MEHVISVEEVCEKWEDERDRGIFKKRALQKRKEYKHNQIIIFLQIQIVTLHAV